MINFNNLPNNQFKPFSNSVRIPVQAYQTTTVKNVLNLKGFDIVKDASGHYQSINGKLRNPNSEAAAAISTNYSYFENFNKGLRTIAASTSLSGILTEAECGINKANILARVERLKKYGVIKNVMNLTTGVYVSIPREAASFIQKGAFTLSVVDRIKQTPFDELYYNISLQDTHTSEKYNVDIIERHENTVSFTFLILTPNLLGNRNQLEKIIHIMNRFRSNVHIIVGSKVDTRTLGRWLEQYRTPQAKIPTFSNMR